MSRLERGKHNPYMTGYDALDEMYGGKKRKPPENLIRFPRRPNFVLRVMSNLIKKVKGK